jgi:RNase adaptor protein for sRNA GlmZ degradation
MAQTFTDLGIFYFIFDFISVRLSNEACLVLENLVNIASIAVVLDLRVVGATQLQQFTYSAAKKSRLRRVTIFFLMNELLN